MLTKQFKSLINILINRATDIALNKPAVKDVEKLTHYKGKFNNLIVSSEQDWGKIGKVITKLMPLL